MSRWQASLGLAPPMLPENSIKWFHWNLYDPFLIAGGLCMGSERYDIDKVGAGFVGIHGQPATTSTGFWHERGGSKSFFVSIFAAFGRIPAKFVFYSFQMKHFLPNCHRQMEGRLVRLHQLKKLFSKSRIAATHQRNTIPESF